jgi:uncharacterized protein YihD (DUF1040 family)
MYQPSSLPEHNSYIHGTAKLLQIIQHLRDGIFYGWKRVLNNLQIHLNDCLVYANKMRSTDKERQIHQTVVNDLQKL